MLSRRMFKNLRNVKEKHKAEEHAEVKDETNWSTDLRVPVMERSFLSSTVTRWSVRVLKTENISWFMVKHHVLYETHGDTYHGGGEGDEDEDEKANSLGLQQQPASAGCRGARHLIATWVECLEAGFQLRALLCAASSRTTSVHNDSM